MRCMSDRGWLPRLYKIRTDSGTEWPRNPHHTRSRTAQMENEELRMGQAILASEVQSLRRDLGSLAARLQVCIG